jgi:hypothetical protein
MQNIIIKEINYISTKVKSKRNTSFRNLAYFLCVRCCLTLYSIIKYTILYTINRNVRVLRT